MYKGDVPATTHVRTVSSEVSCGYEFHERSRYLVHVQFDQAGQWTTGLCSGNHILPAEPIFPAETGGAPAGGPSPAPGPDVALPTGASTPGPPADDPRWAWVIVPVGGLAGGCGHPPACPRPPTAYRYRRSVDFEA